MTDPTGNTPDSAIPEDAAPSETAAPQPPAFDASPYVAPAAPAYDTTPYPPSPAYPSPPTPPAAAYPPPGPAAGGYGTAPAYGSAPVQSTPGAPPVMPYGYGGYAPAPRTNGLAVAAMVLSILGFIWVLPFVGSIAGAIMGHISLGQITRSGEGGRGMALAGVIVGWAGLALVILGALFIAFIVAASAGSGRFA